MHIERVSVMSCSFKEEEQNLFFITDRLWDAVLVNFHK